LQDNIGRNIEALRARIENACRRGGRDVSEVKLIAVAKNFDSRVVRAAFDYGLRDFGENRVQEAAGKYSQLADVRGQLTLHYIGHLQTNKAADAVQIVDIIHSVDSLRLAGLLSARAGRLLPVFLEVNLAGEPTKYGFSREDLGEAVESVSALPNINILGLMTVAPVYNDAEQARPLFADMKGLNSAYGFKELSMGMTDDFEVAVQEGATMLRIGRAIFGERS